MPAFDIVSIGFVFVFVIAAVLILSSMLLHTAVFGTVLYSVLRRLRQSGADSRPLSCAHCGVVRAGPQTICPHCGAPFDVPAAPMG